MIDAGRTRLERHAEIIDMNIERGVRSSDPVTRAWARWEKEQRAEDRALERELVVGERRRTIERRRMVGHYRNQFRDLRTQEKAQSKAAAKATREAYAPALTQLRARQVQERLELAKKESSVFKRIAVMLDFTGTAKRRRDAARKTLSKIHRGERQQLASSYKADRQTQQEAIRASCAAARQDIVQDRDRRMASLKDRHREAQEQGDTGRQAREADREQSRASMDVTLRAWRWRRG